MLGAIIGDIIGSPYEWRGIKTTDFPLFSANSRPTDDSVLTVATAEAILSARPYRATYRECGRRFPRAGYGGMFIQWLNSETADAYGSYGNGSAMRISPVGWLRDDAKAVEREAVLSAECTHNHPEGIKGAVVTALAVFHGRHGMDKAGLQELAEGFGYTMNRSIDQIRPQYTFDATCQGSVPQALRCVYEAGSYEEAVRPAVSLGGDSDTQACIAGAVAEALWGIPADIQDRGLSIVKATFPDLLGPIRKFETVRNQR